MQNDAVYILLPTVLHSCNGICIDSSFRNNPLHIFCHIWNEVKNNIVYLQTVVIYHIFYFTVLWFHPETKKVYILFTKISGWASTTSISSIAKRVILTIANITTILAPGVCRAWSMAMRSSISPFTDTITSPRMAPTRIKRVVYIQNYLEECIRLVLIYKINFM